MNLLDRAFGAVYDPMMRGTERAGLGAKRRELLAGLRGHVVEIGAGTGANLEHLGVQVERVTLLEPNRYLAARLRDRVARVEVPAALQVGEAPAEALPLPDHSVDAVVSTLVLCSVDDLSRSLAEIHRVLRPEGTLVLIEHVAAGGSLGLGQRILAPAWSVVARGCQLHRDIGSAVAGAGFDVSRVERWRLPGGGPAAPAIAGTARRP